MSLYVVLSQSQVTARAMSGWLALLGEDELHPGDCRCIVWSKPEQNGERSIEEYETLCRSLESAAMCPNERFPLNEIIVIVDQVRPERLNAVESSGWDSIVAMLILTFPEIHWVFAECTGTRDATWRQIEEDHSLLSLLFKPRREPLFDPTGLRNKVRATTNSALSGIDDLQLPERTQLAAAIDEEKPYAYLHGYAAYRFGYRTDLITTWALMEELFCGLPKPHQYELLLEDMSLNLPDRPKNIHLLHLEERAQHCPRLDSSRSDIEVSQYRILITSGQSRPSDSALAENAAYLRAKAFGVGRIVLKPTSGFFDLWAKAGLFRKVFRGGNRRGNATSFRWPPSRPELGITRSGHGSPGKLLLIADALTDRAEALTDTAKSVGDAVRGAVLVGDALELTGCRTPTTAINALTLKHRFEVEAECQFSGVEYHLRIKPRLDEIAGETTTICRWFTRRQQRRAGLNAEMGIVYELVKTLRDYNQFDEEQLCMNRVRYLHNTLWMRERRFRLLLWPFLRYLEFLLSSFGVFILVLVFWVIGLSLLFTWANDWYHPGGPGGFADALSTFFAGSIVQHPDSPGYKENAGIGWAHVSVVCLAIVSGFVHLGVFISHLYAMMSRK